MKAIGFVGLLAPGAYCIQGFPWVHMSAGICRYVSHSTVYGLILRLCTSSLVPLRTMRQGRTNQGTAAVPVGTRGPGPFAVILIEGCCYAASERGARFGRV